MLNSFLTSSKMNYGLFPTIFCTDDSEANMAASEKPALCGKSCVALLQADLMGLIYHQMAILS